MDVSSLMSDRKLITQVTTVLFAVVLICYFIPFISFVGESISGFEIMFDLFSSEYFGGEGTMISIWAIVAFLAGAAGLVFCLNLIKLKAKMTPMQTAGICGTVSVVALLLCRIAFNSAMEDALGSYASLIDLSMGGAGWWIAFIAGIIATAGAFYANVLGRKQQQPPIVY